MGLQHHHNSRTITSVPSLQNQLCSIMKLCVVLLASLCVGCFAVDIGMLITNEVREIVHANPGMTLVDCATKCDAEFDLIAGKDEAVVDNYCHAICDCVINQHCPNSHATRPPHTQPTRHTFRPHVTRSP